MYSIRSLGMTQPTYKEEIKALCHLENNREIIFKPSDKGGNLVVLDHVKYKKMVYDILVDKRCYGVLKEDPMDIFKHE